MTMPVYGQFHRIEQMLGVEAVQQLHTSRVIVAGLGAVGGFALEALARSGVGSFCLIDCDTIKPSNINRQILALWPTVDLPKTEVARQRILAINPNAQIDIHNVLLNASTIGPLLDSQPHTDFLVDAIDSLGPKVELIASTLQRNIPIISSMGAALRTDPSAIRVGPLTEVTHCPLSAMVRKRLRRRGVSTDDVPCVYSPEPVRELHGQHILPPECSEDDRSLPGRRRSTLGSLPTITGIFGLILAHEVIRRLAAGKENKS